MYKTLEKYF